MAMISGMGYRSEVSRTARRDRWRASSIAIGIDGLAQLPVFADRDQPWAVSDERQTDLKDPLAHPRYLVQQLARRAIVERWIPHRVFPVFERCGPRERIGEQIRPGCKVFPVFRHQTVQVRR